MVNGNVSGTQKKSSVEKKIETTRKQIATYFCAECNAERCEINGEECVVFTLDFQDCDELKTPPLPLDRSFNPDPVEYFIKAIYVKPARKSVRK